METELNCKNCGEQSLCWHGQNKEPKKCDSYWNASSVRADSGERRKTMDIMQKLVELLDNFHRDLSPFAGNEKFFVVDDNVEQAEYLIAHGVTVQECARPLEEWGEDYGDVLWWKFPIEEPPHVGSPLDADWPGYHTHWTPITLPRLPQED